LKKKGAASGEKKNERDKGEAHEFENVQCSLRHRNRGRNFRHTIRSSSRA
jgi:hypothetical protein